MKYSTIFLILAVVSTVLHAFGASDPGITMGCLIMWKLNDMDEKRGSE